MRRIISWINLLCSTIILSTVAIIVSFFDNKGSGAHLVGRFWAGCHLKVSGIKVVVKGLEHLTNPPYVFMCNHQSALDIYTLQAFLPYSFKWIAKRQLFKIPFIGWAMGRTGYISIDREKPREALKAMEEAAQKIRNGMNIVIFPEGTRSVDGTLLPFKKGGFTLALRAMVPIVPIGIYGTSRLQPKGSFIPKEKGVIYIHIGEPIILEGMDRSAKTRVMDDVRVDIERLTACQGN
jgi:1-acyl-sn-glycerol-3-phosphate acyltransferase